MSLKIYLDDCACAKTLVKLLNTAGHQVTTPSDAGLAGMDDDAHFKFAIQNQLVLITKDPDDYAELHAAHSKHSGILAIYHDNDPD